MDKYDWVWMKHPDLPDHEPSLVSPRAFEGTWQHKGWILVENEAPTTGGDTSEGTNAEDQTAPKEVS